MGERVRGVVAIWRVVLGRRPVAEETTTTCSPSVDHQHGPAPYAHSYNYNAINNLTSGPAGTYSYPTPGLGVSRPHAPTSINGVGHSWNAAGQLTSRTGQWSATYTPQGQTATITAGNQRTVYAYGPDAERVLTHTINTATGTLTSSTLTLGNLGELTIDHATGSLQAARFLTMAGTTVAVRANDGTLTWPLGNHQGSIVATVTTAGATQRHLYTPYGAARTTPPATTATRGFLNQPHNTTHQLSHLHHRHYDPHSGIFTTVDPLVTATGTPYLYANANPTTLSDPNGLEPGCGPHATPAQVKICKASHLDASHLAASNRQSGQSWWEERSALDVLPGERFLQGVGGGLSLDWRQAVAAVAGAGAFAACIYATAGSGMIGCAVGAGAIARNTDSMLRGHSPRQTAANVFDWRAVMLDAIAGGACRHLSCGSRQASSRTSRSAPNTAGAVERGGLQIAEGNAGHIFRNAAGHLAEDTPANRAIIQAAAGNGVLVRTSPHGVQTFRQLLPDGTEAWAEVYQGQITNGGVNIIPRSP